MSSVKFTFVHIPGKTPGFFKNASVQENIMKWSLKGHTSIQYYSFNESFNVYQKQEFAEAFFKDPNVYNSLLKTCDSQQWVPIGEPLPNVKVETIPCSITSLEFFDRIYNLNNQIIRQDDGEIIKCFEEQMEDNIFVSDNLRMMLLNKESDMYNMYTESERNQFLFRLFNFFCIGGQWCQYEDNVNPYVDTAKLLYKDLLSVERVSDTNELVVRSVVIKVIAKNKNGTDEIPYNSKHFQNFLYMIIDPFTRQITTFCHQWDGYFIG